MKTVFADSVYFFAVLNAHDCLHERAVRYAAEGVRPILTTAWVLAEIADGLCHHTVRQTAVRLFETLGTAADVEIVPPTLELFHRGFERYRQRHDKDWSLTDCISFIVMEERGITEALTSDHHFQQAGFVTLLS